MEVRRLKILLVYDRDGSCDWVFNLLTKSDLGQVDLDCIQSQELSSMVRQDSTHDLCLIDSREKRSALFAQLHMLGVEAPVVIFTSDSGLDVLDAWHHGAADCLIKNTVTAPGLEESICAVIAYARTSEATALCQRYYLGLIEHTTDLIFTHDLEGNYTSINRVGEVVFGYSQEEILTMSFRQIVAPECIEAWEQSIWRLLETCKTEWQQLQVVTRIGERIPLMLSSHLIYQNGTPIGVQSVGRISSEMLPLPNVGPGDLLEERVRFEL